MMILHWAAMARAGNTDQLPADIQALINRPDIAERIRQINQQIVNQVALQVSFSGWRERRIMQAYRSCLYRGPAIDTGCNCRRVCFAGKGENGIVRTEDCRACVATLAITDQRTA